MGSRISTIQRQARELGRLRTGTFNPEAGKGKGAPQRSKTWIVTSPYENQVEAAAQLWGGTPEKWQPQGSGAPQMRVITDAAVIEAILPPGDPVDQSYETWSKGGVQRRCNGTSEAISGQPCICRATWGDEFYEVAKDDACKMTTRLNVILPQMPDMGVFRVETHSFYSANEIAASVDIIRAAVGENRLVPVNLRIEPRTRVAQGKTKHFPVIVVEIRGVTSGELLAATMAAKGELGGARAAIEAARPDYLALAQDATTPAEVTAIWNQALAAGHLDDELKAKLSPIGIALRAAEQKAAQEAAGEQSAAEEVAEACAHDAEYDPDCKGCQAHQAAEDRRLAAES